jgi:hypothetical protein
MERRGAPSSFSLLQWRQPDRIRTRGPFSRLP